MRASTLCRVLLPSIMLRGGIIRVRTPAPLQGASSLHELLVAGPASAEILKSRFSRDELKEQCKRIVKARGFENVTTEDLAREITPVGRATVPDAVKAELLQNIRKFLQP